VLGWIGNVFIVGGLYGVGNKWRHAFLLSMLGECFYITRSYLLGDWALLSIGIVLLLMAGRAWVKWGREDTCQP
jgi:hypothetical protein